MTLRIRFVHIISFVMCALSVPASAQLEPNSPDQIAAATVDCWDSVSDGPFDVAKFEARGWKKPSFKEEDGKPFNSPLDVYKKSDSTVFVVLLPRPGAENSCKVVSRLGTPQEIDASAQALLGKLREIEPKIQLKRNGSAYVYYSKPRGAVLESIGTMEKPAIKIIVVYEPLEKK